MNQTTLNFPDFVPGQLNAYRGALAKKMRNLREKLGCTQAEMADALGEGRGYIGQLESQYQRMDVERAAALVKRAYDMFGAKDTLPAPAVVAPPNPPAEVETAAVAPAEPTALGLETSKRVKEFQKEFGLRPKELTQIFHLSGGHEYVIRNGRPGPSEATLRTVLALIEGETAKRRAAAVRTRPAVTDTVVKHSANTAVIAPMATRSSGIVAHSDAALLAAISMDFKTAHKFMKLPDGSILVVKEM